MDITTCSLRYIALSPPVSSIPSHRLQWPLPDSLVPYPYISALSLLSIIAITLLLARSSSDCIISLFMYRLSSQNILSNPNTFITRTTKKVCDHEDIVNHHIMSPKSPASLQTCILTALLLLTGINSPYVRFAILHREAQKHRFIAQYV